jgi:hypothetical protein
MNILKFKKSWNNKLACDIFTTIRRLTPEKLEYYSANINKEFDVTVGIATECYAKLIGMRTDILANIPPEMLFTDTGSLEPMEIFKEFGLKADSEVIILTFQRLKE